MSNKGDIIEALLALWRGLSGHQLALLGQTDFNDIFRFNINLSDACTATLRLVQMLHPHDTCTPQVFSSALEVANLAFEDQAIKGKCKTQKR